MVSEPLERSSVSLHRVEADLQIKRHDSTRLDYSPKVLLRRSMWW